MGWDGKKKGGEEDGIKSPFGGMYEEGRGEMDKMHGIMEAIREVEGKQLRYLNMIWKRLLGITDESKLPPSTTRQMPCIIGGENEHNLIPFYEGGRDAREREKHNEAERGGGKREGEMPFLPPEKRRYKEVCVKWLRM